MAKDPSGFLEPGSVIRNEKTPLVPCKYDALEQAAKEAAEDTDKAFNEIFGVKVPCNERTPTPPEDIQKVWDIADGKTRPLLTGEVHSANDYEEGQWWHKAVQDIWTATTGSAITQDQKRAAKVTLDAFRIIKKDNETYKAQMERLVRTLRRIAAPEHIEADPKVALKTVQGMAEGALTAMTNTELASLHDQLEET